MKKLFLSFAVIAGFTMVSCCSKAENAEAADAIDTVAVIEETVEVAAPVEGDSVVADSAVVVEEAAAAVAE